MRMSQLISHYKLILKRKLNPFKCDYCGKKVYFKSPEYFTNTYPKLGLAFSNKRCTCRACALKLMTEAWKAAAYSEDFQRYTCDVCDTKDVLTVKHFSPYTSGKGYGFYFCSHSWNSAYVCLACASRPLLEGLAESGIFEYNKGKTTAMSHGVPVTIEERLL